MIEQWMPGDLFNRVTLNERIGQANFDIGRIKPVLNVTLPRINAGTSVFYEIENKLGDFSRLYISGAGFDEERDTNTQFYVGSKRGSGTNATFLDSRASAWPLASSQVFSGTFFSVVPITPAQAAVSCGIRAYIQSNGTKVIEFQDRAANYDIESQNIGVISSNAIIAANSTLSVIGVLK